MDLISIIVPVYQVERYLNQCVSSLVHQSYQCLEIILVDDGSPDQCPQMCDEWAKKDTRIKVIHKANGGLSDARNAGLEIAEGDYIAFVDSDDWVSENFIEMLYREIQNTDADICECSVIYVDDEGNTLRTRSCKKEVVIYPRAEAIKALIREDGIYQTVWNKLYAKEVVEGIPFEVGKHHEDDFWTYQVFDRVDKLSVLDMPLYYYRQRSGSIMGKGYQLKRLDGLEAKIKRKDYYEYDAVLFNYTRAWLQYDLLYHLQCALKYLKNEEQEKVKNCVLDQLRRLGNVQGKQGDITFKYRIWFFFFRRFPIAVAILRNLLGIGY